MAITRNRAFRHVVTFATAIVVIAVTTLSAEYAIDRFMPTK